MFVESLKLKAQKKVVYVQPYNPHASEEAKRPFIIVIQDEWMLQTSLRFSHNNSWAIDSTFKTNIYGLPLYGVVLPNQHGMGLPIWFMMCTNDPGTTEESNAIELTFKLIFSRMGNVRPKAIIIDKSAQELEAILKVVNQDPNCWIGGHEGDRVQTGCHVLVCWFHTKKAWVENLLPQVPIDKRDHIYSALSELMQTPTEEEFETRYQQLLMTYSMHANVQRYVSNGWCAKTCIWRNRWPKFGRMFPHGKVDTTNLIERLWQYIKYTLLDARINRSILELLHALVGDSVTGTRMGGTLLEFFKQKQELGDS